MSIEPSGSSGDKDVGCGVIICILIVCTTLIKIAELVIGRAS